MVSPSIIERKNEGLLLIILWHIRIGRVAAHIWLQYVACMKEFDVLWQDWTGCGTYVIELYDIWVNAACHTVMMNAAWHTLIMNAACDTYMMKAACHTLMMNVSWYIRMGLSWYMCEWGMSCVWIDWCVVVHMWMRHVTCVNGLMCRSTYVNEAHVWCCGWYVIASYHMYECGMSRSNIKLSWHIRIECVVVHMWMHHTMCIHGFDVSWYMCEWGVSLVWCFGTYVIGSYHMCEWNKSRVWIDLMCRGRSERVVADVWMRHVANYCWLCRGTWELNVSLHTWIECVVKQNK